MHFEDDKLVWMLITYPSSLVVHAALLQSLTWGHAPAAALFHAATPSLTILVGCRTSGGNGDSVSTTV